MIFKTVTLSELETHYAPAREAFPYANVRAYWVPIMFRETMLEMYRELGIKVRLRYRGPRAHSVGREMPCIGSDRTYRRTRHQANQDCLLADATHFTVYERS